MANSEKAVPVKVEYNYPIPMRDGTILRANVFRPEKDGKFPVLLNRIPYCKEILQGIFDPIEAAKNDYVVVLQDVRGRFASEGDFYPFDNEISDGYDTVEFLANAPWSNGNIGMFGTSYEGYTQWFAAASHPPHLKTITPFQSAPYLFDFIKESGAFRKSLCLSYSLLISVNLSVRKKGTIENILIDGIDNMEDWFKNIPDDGVKMLKELAPFYFDWKNYSDPNDDYWQKFNIIEKFKNINIPILYVGCWHDIFANNTIKTFNYLRKNNIEYIKLIMGPWDHNMPFDNIVGETNFGFLNSYAMHGIPQILFRWFDRYLKEIDNGLEQEKAIELFDLGTKKWYAFEEWPEPDGTKNYYLEKSNGRNFRLNENQPEEGKQEIEILFDPDNPVPSLGGLPYFAPSGKAYNQGAFDQRRIEARDDVISFSTETLKESLKILGRIKCIIYASTPAEDLDICLKLIDFFPDGRAINLMESITRSSYYQTAKGDKILPGKIYKFEIDMSYTCIEIEEGHKIKLDVACSNFPSYEIINNSSNGTERILAENKIYTGNEFPSHVIIPVTSY